MADADQRRSNGEHLAARDALREVGLRVTGPRIAVLDALDSHPHADTETLAGVARDRLGSVSTQAVYDVLAALTDAGLVRRIEPAGHPTRYEKRVGDNHHHLVCRSCGAVADVDCATGHAPCLAPEVDHGFAVEEAEVIFWGQCAACQREGHLTAPHQPARAPRAS